MSRTHHLDEDLAINDNYLTLEFRCDTTPADKKYDRILVKVLVLKEIFSLVIIFHICDIRVYHFDSGCGQPDIPESTNVQLSDDGGYEYRCKGDRHFLDGVSRVMCDSYGKWMNEFPRCIPKSYCQTVSNDSIGDFVDIRYEYQMRAKSGQVWVPDGVSVHFSCNTIQNMTQKMKHIMC